MFAARSFNVLKSEAMIRKVKSSTSTLNPEAVLQKPVIDRYWFFITDTDTYYLYVYVPDNRYAEPIFIYCYKVSEVSPFFAFSRLNNNKN